MDHLADSFRMRILHHSSEICEDAWDTCIANLIGKIARPQNITQFRPIAILPVVSKLYSKLLLYLAKPFMRSLRAPQFAFTSGFQPHEVVFILRRSIEVALEWNIPIWILDGDIKKAYDNTLHTEVLDSLQEAGCPDIISAAWVRELRSMGVKMKLGNLVTPRINRTRALFQGDPSAPFIFNHALDRPLFDFQETAQRKKWGIPLSTPSGTYHMAILAFADNYWLCATSPAELQTMLKHWLSLLKAHGWHTPHDEICYCTTANDDQYCREVLAGSDIIKRVPRKVGFKVLGTFITFDQNDDVELARRTTAAWGAFNKFASLLKCREIDLGVRFQMLAKAVHPAMFWCAGSWNLRGDQLPTVRDVQRSMIRKMLGQARREDEELADFMQRSNSNIKNLMNHHNVLPWDLLVHRHSFRWAGKLVQIKVENPTRLTSLVFCHKDWSWIKCIAGQNRGRQLHGRCLHTWRWERPFYKGLGDNWQVIAADALDWQTRERDFLTWRSVNR